MYPTQRLWALTDMGAATWLQLIQAVRSQQADIAALRAEVNCLKTLPTRQAPALPAAPTRLAGMYAPGTTKAVNA